MKPKYKVVVVGSGPGGSTAAYYLAKRGIDVLMLEQGSYHKQNRKIEYSSQEMYDKYKNCGLTVAVGNAIINYAEGACVGGGSEVNSGLYHEIPESVLKAWEAKNHLSFDRKQLANSYQAIKALINVSYMPEDKIPLASIKMKQGAQHLGWQCAEIPRWYQYDSAGNALRQSMTETLIPQYLKMGGELISDTQVIKVDKKKQRNQISFVTLDNKVKSVETDYVFFAAGAIDTPLLLKNSGLSKRAGQTLKMHPSFKFTALFDERVNFPDMGIPVHQVKEHSPDISLGCSISSKAFIALALNDSRSMSYLDQWQNMATYYSMISPTGRGNVIKIPGFQSPWVTFNLSKEDRRYLRQSILYLGELLFASNAAKIFPSANVTGPIESIKQLHDSIDILVNKMNLMTIHLFASVAMGDLKAGFELSPDGYLWNDNSIYVSDGSMLCDSPSVNPQGTIMALARMNVLKFIERMKNEF